MALHEVSVPKSLDYSSLAEVTNLRKEFGYMLKYLTCLKHYVMADIMGEARLDKKTKEILKRLNEYIYEPQDRFVARTNEKLRSSWRPEEAAKRAQ